MQICTVKCSSPFKESPCSPVVTFPSFRSEGHGVQPLQGDSFFSIVVFKFTCTFLCNLFIHDFSNQIASVGENRFRKVIKSAWQGIICILLGLFSFKVCLFELLSNGRFKKGSLQKNGSLVKGSFILLNWERFNKGFQENSLYRLSKVFNLFLCHNL